MADSFEILDAATVVADAITTATGRECIVTGARTLDLPAPSFLGLQPLSVRRNKIDRRGIQIDYAFEVYYIAETTATTVTDTVLAQIEDHFFSDPRVVGQVGGNDVQVVFQKMVYSSETNIINGGILEGYYSATDLDERSDQVQAAMIYFSAWYEVNNGGQS